MVCIRTTNQQPSLDGACNVFMAAAKKEKKMPSTLDHKVFVSIQFLRRTNILKSMPLIWPWILVHILMPVGAYMDLVFTLG